MNGAGVCWIIGRTVCNVYVCLNRSSRYKYDQIETNDEKLRHQKIVFSKFRQFFI